MKINTTQAVCKLLIVFGIFSIQARAQLSTYVDERGTLVFTNADVPAPRASAKAASSAPASGSQKLPAAAAAPASPPGALAAPVVAPHATIATEPSTAVRSTTSSASQFAVTGSATPFVATRSAAPPAYDRIVLQAAEKHHVDPKLVRAVIATESSWNSAAISRKGALGLMQLIPGTARQMGVGDAFDPEQNVDGGTHYLGMLLERYNGDVGKALAAYNAGPGAVDRFGGVPNYPETRDYVRRVTSTYFSGGSVQTWTPAPRPIYRSMDANGRLIFTNE